MLAESRVARWANQASQVKILLAVDGDVGVPFVVVAAVFLAAARTVADGVAGVADGDAADVAYEVGFFFEEVVLRPWWRE